MLGYDHWGCFFPCNSPSQTTPFTHPQPIVQTPLPYPILPNSPLPPLPQLVHLNKLQSLASVNIAVARASYCRYFFFRYPILRMLNMVNFHWTALVDFDYAVNFSHKEEASKEAHSTYNKIQVISFRWETKVQFQKILSNIVISVETPCAPLEAKR